MPAELLPEGVDSASYYPGQFLDAIRNNWLGGGRVATRRTPQQMAAMERLPWGEAWVEGRGQQRAAREASYQPSVAAKVAWLGVLKDSWCVMEQAPDDRPPWWALRIRGAQGQWIRPLGF